MRRLGWRSTSSNFIFLLTRGENGAFEKKISKPHRLARKLRALAPRGTEISPDFTQGLPRISRIPARSRFLYGSIQKLGHPLTRIFIFVREKKIRSNLRISTTPCYLTELKGSHYMRIELKVINLCSNKEFDLGLETVVQGNFYQLT